MEASTRISTPTTLSFEPNTDKIKRNLLKKGVFPTPKTVHTLRKKEIQKFNRKSKKIEDKPFSESEKQEISEQSHFNTITREYKAITKVFKAKNDKKGENLMVGKPWERLERIGLRELASGSKEYGGEKLKGEALVELSEILAERNRDDKHWLLDEDIEEGYWMETNDGRKISKKREIGDAEAIQFLVKRLSAMDLTMRDWKFSKLMKQSGLHFTERHLLKIIEGLGAVGSWRNALSVVEWVYNRDEYKHQKSRFVYTKLLAVLGKARKPTEALHIFNLMREDCRIYPDMAAYRCISVTLGQAGLVKKLMNVIECMRQKPSKKLKNMRSRDWDPCLEPDVVVYNAVLNACVPSHQWKAVSWVMEEMRKLSLKPNGATYGLAMEVMLRSGKYDLVHKFFEKMRKSGTAPKAITYKVLVRAFWEEGKVNEAVEAVRDMERRGVVGTASVYYELACCLCKNGRWIDAMVEVEKLKKLHLTKPLEVAFTGMITSCMDGGHVNDCISVFEEMNKHCSPNTGTINAMLKAYGRNDMFAKAKELFEKTKEMESSRNTHISGFDSSLTLDAYTYSSILEASAKAHQWEYFEYVYKEMTLFGYQLDQNKHAWLLVEASKAGKGHLMEHAFDLILEAGEIPHLSFFTEMVCHATAQHNYRRAVNLVNSMAHASFHVSEKQWTEIFMGCQDRIGKGGLQNLFYELCNSDIVSETTISNLMRSLQLICGITSAAESLGSTVSSNVTPDRLPSDEEREAFPIDMVDHVDSGLISDSPSCVVNRERNTSFTGKPDSPQDGVALSVPDVGVDYNSSTSTFSGNSQDYIDNTLDSLTSHLDDSRGSDLPQASEILKEWREARNKDGIFMPFE
ncbi:hypothetical protein AQUCO_01700047v1 [Aquilegia coerulea]|uniref:PROP1-like PPR domain-containing protein n=1 Tax=Aquilegia coerulea TaxID=218851 RepID=A0A2G5DKY6_AQUCA|nr:hypothetical protein AQUCO_01700047v1 [Aquilegia coerulea]